MHPYESEGARSVSAALAGLSILLVWVLHSGLEQLNFDPKWWFSVPSFAGTYSGLHWLFDRFVWRLQLVRRLRLIQTPDLNGQWEGELESSYYQDRQTTLVTVDITQTWSKLTVRLETEHSRSRSVIASLKTIGLPNSELTYQFINEPKSSAPSSMEMHRGTATLELVSTGFVGDYYTGRGRGEIGTIKLWKK